jgi:two-component system response regulator YesN
MVDDEETVRRGFETRIDWAGAGFEFLPPCENGRDAIEAIDRLIPDVVLTDICMPFADGISVAAHVAKNHPNIVVVVLSGFDEFRYAQEAIRHNVFDYILKPVTARDLTALLLRVKGKLDAGRRVEEDAAELKSRAEKSRAMIRERSIVEFLASPGAASSPKDPGELFGFDPSALACAALVVEGEPSSAQGEHSQAAERVPAETEALGIGMRALFGRVFGAAPRVVTFFPEEGRGGALVFERDIERCAKQVDYFASEIVAAGSEPLCAGIGLSYMEWRDAPRSYDEAVAALAYRLVRNAPGPFRYPRNSDDDRGAVAEVGMQMDRLCFGIRTGTAEQATVLAASFIRSLAASDLSPLRIRHEIQEFFARALDELADIGISASVVAGDLGCDYYEYVQSLDSRDAILAAVRRIAELSSRVNATRNLNQPEWKILDFKEYIERHYSDPNLWIRTVAEGLSISESYLSKILRRQLKCSFVEYLTNYRVARARSLLESTDLMGYEIANAVGYPDAGYFGAVFKRLIGMTPTEYRAGVHRGFEAEEGSSNFETANRPRP